MKIGYVGDGPLAAAAARRLAQTHEIARPGADASLVQLARDCEVIFICAASQREAREVLFSAKGLASGTVVVDQTPGDPDQSQANAAELGKQGVVLLDAPIHCERIEAIPEATAITCGGPAEVFASIRPLLECITPQVVFCGDTGSGQAARLVISAVAACNRLVTYECATVGLKNGLAMEHMAEVLNRSSGYNSAAARVLPVLASGGQTTDTTLGAIVEDLRLASRLAMRCGAPLLVANVGRTIFEAAAAELGADAILDAVARPRA